MYFVPGMATTLVSVSELVEAGCEVVAKKVRGAHAMELVMPSGSRCVLPVKGGLYPVEGGGVLGGQYFESELEGCGVRGCVAVSGAAGTKLRGNSHVGSIPLDELLHRRLGHVSWQSSKLAGRLRAVFGAKLGQDHKSASCEACVLAKMKQSFSRSPPTRPATRPLEREVRVAGHSSEVQAGFRAPLPHCHGHSALACGTGVCPQRWRSGHDVRGDARVVRR